MIKLRAPFEKTAYQLFSKTSARIGQKLAHFPHLMQILSSTLGALNPCCLRAPTGQTLIDGHRWF